MGSASHVATLGARGFRQRAALRAAIATLLCLSVELSPVSAQSIAPNPSLPNPAAAAPQPWPDYFMPSELGSCELGAVCWVEVRLYGNKPTFEVVTDVGHVNFSPYVSPDGTWALGGGLEHISNNPDGRFHQIFNCDPDVHESIGSPPAPCQTWVGLDAGAGPDLTVEPEQVTMNFGHAGTWSAPVRADGAGCAAVQSVDDDLQQSRADSHQWTLSCTFSWNPVAGQVISVYYRGAQWVGCSDDTHKTPPSTDHWYNAKDFPTLLGPAINLAGKACKDYPPDDPLAHQKG